MKNKLMMIAMVAAAIGFGTSAKANQYSDAQLINSSVAAGGTYASTFNIVTPLGSGFTVNSGIFDVTTQNGGKSYSSVGGYVLNTPISSGDVSIWIHSTGDVKADIQVDLNVGSVSQGPVYFQSASLTGSIIATLQSSGQVTWSVKNTSLTAFTLDYGLLRVNVPDGGTTVLLLGTALTGLGLLRRKLTA